MKKYVKKENMECEKKTQDVIEKFRIIRGSKSKCVSAKKMSIKEMVDYGRRR